MSAYLFWVSACCFALENPHLEYFEKGQTAYENNDLASAVKFLEKSIEADPNYAPSYNALGLAKRDLNKDLNEIIWCFKVAIDIDPQFVEAHENLGEIYYLAGDYGKAEEYLTQSLKLNPQQAKTRYFLAWTFLKETKLDDAIFYFKEVLNFSPIPNAYYGLGTAYSMKKDNAMVLDVVTKLRSIGQSDLASQLEAMIRLPYTPVPVEPPSTQQSEPVLKPVQTTSPVNSKLSIHQPSIQGVTTIRLRGSMTNTEPAKKTPYGVNP